MTSNHFVKEVAEKARLLYRSNQITREQARQDINPYIDAYNQKAIEIAKKYNMKAKKITFATFVR